MKIIELPTMERRSPVFECENCGRQSLISQMHVSESRKRLACHCGKDSITIPQNASDWKITRNTEHESTGETIGRDGLGDISEGKNTPTLLTKIVVNGIIARLRRVADEMEECGQALQLLENHVTAAGSFQRGCEMKGAADMARQWASEICKINAETNDSNEQTI